MRNRRDVDSDEASIDMLDEFVPFPAPEIAARTLASFLFGESAKFESKEAQVELDALIEDNHLHALNQEAGITCAVEGEVYYKVDWDDEISDVGLISVVGGGMAFPRFRFGRLAEVAFAWEVERNQNDSVVIRHVELRKRGAVIHRLFKGSDDSLGTLLQLEDHATTEGLAEAADDEGVVETEIDDLLVRHVPFWRTTRSRHGISVFRGKDGLVEALHSLYSQDQHDAEMAKRRIALASNYLKRDSKGRPRFDRALDLFELSDEAMGMVGGDNKPIHAIEFTDSTVMGQRIAQRLDEFLLACGIAPQSAGRDVAGGAESGTARRLAQSLTLQTVATAGRYFTPALRDIVDLALQAGKTHLGASVPNAYVVSVSLSDGTPEDPVELSTIVSNLSTATAISIEQKVRMLHADWDDAAVLTEVETIKEEEALTIPSEFTNPTDDDEEDDDE